METTIKSKNSLFITATEVSEMNGRVQGLMPTEFIKQMNDELSRRGFLVIQGKTSKKYFYEKVYGKE